jgi:hypothetical protein
VGRKAKRAPLRRLEIGSGAGALSPARRPPLVRFAALRSLLGGRPAGPSVPRPRLVFGVSVETSGSFRPPSPAHRSKRVHPPLSFAPLQSPPFPIRPPPLAKGSFLGVAVPLRDLSAVRRYGELPPSPPSVLGVSHALDGLIRPAPGGPVSSHRHVQGSPFRGLLLARSRLPHRQPWPSRHWAAARCRGDPQPRRLRPARGATLRRPVLRALLHARIRDRPGGG